MVDRRPDAKGRQAIIRRLQVGLPDVRTPVKSLSGGQRQAVAVARAMSERTARMADYGRTDGGSRVRESASSTTSMKALKGRGPYGALDQSQVEHVFNLADRVVVFLLGRCIADLPDCRDYHAEVIGLIVRGQERLIPSLRDRSEDVYVTAAPAERVRVRPGPPRLGQRGHLISLTGRQVVAITPAAGLMFLVFSHLCPSLRSRCRTSAPSPR